MSEAPRLKVLVCRQDGAHPQRTKLRLETDAEKEDRFQWAATRKVRRLCGWNVFCKTKMAGMSLNMEEYRAMQKQLSLDWKGLSAEERLDYEAEATHQEELRHELAQTPLAAGGAVDNDRVKALEQDVGKKSCRHFSARRLLLNEAEFDRHSVWSLPTCLADSHSAHLGWFPDYVTRTVAFLECNVMACLVTSVRQSLPGNGALKVDKIDMAKSDEEIEELLDKALHGSVGKDPQTSEMLEEPEQQSGSEVEAPPAEGVEAHGTPCFPFMCMKSPHAPRVNQLVKALQWALQDNRIQTGSLLLFSVSSSAEPGDIVSMPCILGIRMGRPILHMLIMAALDDQQVSLLRPGRDRPQIQFSHELFLEILEDHFQDPDALCTIRVEAWKCTAFLETQDNLCELRGNPSSLLCSFEITSEKRQKKPPAKIPLPFGLEKSLRRVRKGQKRESKAKAKPQRKPTKRAGKKGDVDATDADALVLSEGSSEIDFDCMASASKPDDAEDMPGEEEEVVQPTSDAMIAETQNLAVAAQEVQDADIARSKAEAAVTQNISAHQSSFFSKEVGLASAAMSVSSRALCFQCKARIPIHVVRYQWYHSTLRPSAWVHCHCLFQLAQSSGLQEQVIGKLREILRDMKGKAKNSSDRNAHDPICAEVRKALDALEEARDS